MNALGWIDYCVILTSIVLPSLVSLFYGVSDARARRDGGSRKSFLRLFPVNMSLMASTLSGMGIIGLPSESYLFGISLWVYSAFTSAFSLLANNYCFLPILYNLPIDSSYEYLEFRFDNRVRTLASFVYLASQIGFAAIAVYPAGMVVNQYVNASIFVVVQGLALLCTAFSAIGGFKGVVWADTYQAIIMWIFLLLYVGVAYVSGGGIREIYRLARDSGRLDVFDFDFDPTLRLTFWSGILGCAVTGTYITALNPAYCQRMAALKSVKDARKAQCLSFAQLYIIFCILNLSGLAIYSTFRNCDPKSAGLIDNYLSIVVYFVNKSSENLEGFRGLFVACVICASMSTMSTNINTSAMVMYEELSKYNKMKPILKNEIASKRVLTVVAGLLSMGFLTVIIGADSMYEVYNRFVGGIVGLLFGLFTLGMFCLSANSRGSFWSGILSIALMFCLSIGSKIYGVNFVNPKYFKAMSIDECPFNASTRAMPTATINDDIPLIFRITPYYYPFMAAVTTVIFGLCFSAITKRPEDKMKQKRELFSPGIRKLYEERFYVEVPRDVQKHLEM